MPSIKDHHSAETTKLLLIGNSGAGKTGSLASLAAAGYRLRILDLDNGIDVLTNYLMDPSSPYAKAGVNYADTVRYITLTDAMKNVSGRIFPAKATVWQRTMKLLDRWQEPGEPPVDLGKLTEWGPQDVLVIDSLSRLSDAAYHFGLMMNGVLGAPRSTMDFRRDVGVAQQYLKSLMELLSDSSIRCNVIVTSHITLVTETGLGPQQQESSGETVKGYPSAIGRALSLQIPRYFNTVLLAEVTGQGANAKHKLFTRSRGQVSAKNTAPLRVQDEYPLASGLADYFSAVRGVQTG